MRLDERVCVVVGSARGIGRAIGMRLASECANVVFADLAVEEADAVAAEARRKGSKAIAVRVDVVKKGELQNVVDRAVAEFGKIDVWFNNAGIAKPQDFLDTTEENWDRIMKVNAWGVMAGTQVAAVQMIKQGHGGKIINTASIAGRQASSNTVPYCASKASVIMIIQAAAREFGRYGITVNGFSPGVVLTPLWTQIDLELMSMGVSSEPGEAMREAASSALLGRIAVPEDIAGVAAFLASSDSDFITGQVINVCGGIQLV